MTSSNKKDVLRWIEQPGLTLWIYSACENFDTYTHGNIWGMKAARPAAKLWAIGTFEYTCIFWRGLGANKSVNNFPPLWTNCYWILLKWSPLFLWKDWCLLLPRVWRILPVKSELLVYRGHWLLPSYISIKNVGVTLTLSYCAAETRSSGGDSRAGE